MEDQPEYLVKKPKYRIYFGEYKWPYTNGRISNIRSKTSYSKHNQQYLICVPL